MSALLSFFQAEDGIRDIGVAGVQTCALPILAGMDQINVEVGQFVLAGEPVASMGQTSSASPAAGAVESSDPMLYVEFRKDGGSIDPGPWWAKSQSEKVRG